MAKWIAMPNFGNAGAGTEEPAAQMPTITFYSFGPGNSFTPGRTISYATTNPVTSVNDVVVYQNGPASNDSYYMFVSTVYTSGPNSGSAGQIKVYAYDGLAAVASGPDPTPATISLQYPPVGMAIQPATGDLYVASYFGGVYVYTNSSGYSTGLQFSASGPGGICADLAFDKDGNLWLSSFGGDYANPQPGTHLLTCYTQVGRAGGTPAGDSTQYIQFGNAAAANFTATAIPGVTAPVSTYYPLAEPNGIAFDPNGNLWLANNDDDVPVNGSGHATLLRISRAWIDQVLSTATNNTLQPIVPGTVAHPGGTVYCVSPYAKFGSLYFDGFTLFVEDEANEVVELFNIAGITDQTLAPAGLTFPASGIAASYPGNGGLTIFNTTPAKLLIRDGAWDSGGPDNPTPAGNYAFESPDIAAAQQSITVMYPSLALGKAQAGNAATDGITLASQSIVGDNTAYIQVRVANYGATTDPASTGTEILKVQWAYASMGLDWPAPWDGEFLYSANEFTGGLVAGAVVIPVLQPGQEAIFEFVWNNVPNPVSYGNSGHFCLLARIEGNALYPFDMAIPEYTGGYGETNVLAQNVMNNSTIAWRNITINPPPSIHRPWEPGTHIFDFPVLGANYGLAANNARFAVEMLDRDGAPARLDGLVTVHAEGPVLERLLAAKLDAARCQHGDGGMFRLHDHARGMANIRLHPKEVFPFRLKFAPTQDVRDFVVRVIQYVEIDGAETVVGGQTFVVGQVRGFPTIGHL